MYNKDLRERRVPNKYGDFVFIYMGDKDEMPPVDVYLNEDYLGCIDYVDLEEMSDMDLVYVASEITADMNED